MKRILILFTASLLFLSCSNDDNNNPEASQELIIKKLTSIRIDANGTPNGNSTVFLFNEDGTLSQKKEDETNSNYTRITNYTYNQLGQLTESYMTFEGVNTSRILTYFYDSTDKLDYITESLDGVDPDIYYQLRYEPNKITVIPQLSGFRDYLNYSNNILTSIDRVTDLGGSSTEVISNRGSNITKRETNGTTGPNNDFSTNQSYQYDDKTNPLYPSFSENPLNLLGENRFNLDQIKLFFSNNNITSEVSTSTLTEHNYTFTKTYQYNEAGYPTSAIVKKDGVLFEELTYEYY